VGDLGFAGKVRAKKILDEAAEISCVIHALLTPLRKTDYPLRAGSRLWGAGCWLLAAGYRLPATAYRLFLRYHQIGSRLPTNPYVQKL
jgi:hypothetical protein